MTIAQKQRIEYLRCRGDSYTAIADDLGIPENTVKSYCRRHNIVVAIKTEKATSALRLSAQSNAGEKT